MSYILEALKKADNARQGDEQVILTQVPEIPAESKGVNGRKMAVIGLSLALLAIVATASGYYWWRQTANQETSPAIGQAARIDSTGEKVVADAPAAPDLAGGKVPTPAELEKLGFPPGFVLPEPPAEGEPFELPELPPQTLADAEPDSVAAAPNPGAENAGKAASDRAATPAPPAAAPVAPLAREMSPRSAAQPSATADKLPAATARKRAEVQPLIEEVDIPEPVFVPAPTRPVLPTAPPIAMPQAPFLSAPSSSASAGARNVRAELAALDIPLLKEKPISFRQSVPAINIDIHVFSESPEKRFVMINMKKYHEGDDLGNGMKLEMIIAEGVVMNLRGEKFRLEAQ